MVEESPSIIIMFVTLILGSLNFCDAPELNTSPPEIDGEILEMIFSAPSEELSEAEIALTLSVLEQRLGSLAEMHWLEDGHFLLVLPSSSSDVKELVIRMATQQGKLEFQFVKENSATNQELYKDDLEPSIFTTNIVINAAAYLDDYSNATVSFDILPEHQDSFAELTEANIGRRLAITIDEEVLMAPTIHGSISDSGVIVGSFDLEEAQDLARMLNSGPLPFPLTYEEVYNVPE